MVERRIELDRRYRRKAKMKKLKAKLANAKDDTERNTVLEKIRRISPWWEMEQAIRARQQAQASKPK